MESTSFLAAVSTGLSANYTTVLLFLLFGIFFGNLALVIAKLVRPSKPGGEKGVAYECGELPVGSSWVRFNIRFYLVALFFIVFDVEVLFLYPWATVFKDLFPVAGSLVFVEMAVFIAILVIGLAYVWAKGDLDWVKTLASRNGTEVSGE
ncbi:MAG TPA: NADH-quinone oxidoreductase subunit A [Candidatus Krumholzibacteria bacterium]|nr:NADH-quinone oxidoreductase subunit A [Candidatus Krumholzibacteria bacterium]HRX52543.1 NADH-quinone oxidoreductase subunit A [Candidatus Krumholzibacteria bacterium]